MTDSHTPAVVMGAPELALIKATIAPDLTDGELRLFGEVCQRRGLDPFTGQIHAVKRGGKMTIQTGIDGFRAKAEDTGLYRGQLGPFWCGPDGEWAEVWIKDYPPYAARVGIVRADFDQPLYAVAHMREYNADTPIWRKMPANQLAKCFSSDTEVLTDHGFRRFPDVGDARVLEATPAGLVPTEARPFAQVYDGPMIGVHGDMLDFTVTPNHDMVTTAGKVEAAAMLASANTQPKWRIPLTVPGRQQEAPVSDGALQLAGYFLADGTAQYRQLRISVSRPRKLAALRLLALHQAEQVKRDAGRVSNTAGRERQITTRSDKTVFVYPHELLAGTGVHDDKTVDMDTLLRLSQRQARLLIDGWVDFDGNQIKATGVRRVFTSPPEHVSIIEVLALAAGYSVNVPRKRTNDLSDRASYMLTVSEPRPQPVIRRKGDRPGIAEERNADGWVWCVTVPSGQIVVRRNGFAMLCGNCAEALAFRKAFPQVLSGLYAHEEMDQADTPAATVTASSVRTDAFPISDTARHAETQTIARARRPPPIDRRPSQVVSLATEAQEADAGPEKITPGTLRRVMAKFTANDIRDRDERLSIAAHVLRRELAGNALTSTKELTEAEGRLLDDGLDRLAAAGPTLRGAYAAEAMTLEVDAEGEAADQAAADAEAEARDVVDVEGAAADRALFHES